MSVTALNQLEKLLTVKEVLEHLRIGRSTLYELIRDGKLTAVKWNRKTYFRATTIQAFIQAHEQSAAEAAAQLVSEEEG